MRDARAEIGPALLGRPVLEVAPLLLGRRLCRRMGGEVIRLPITEVEAYDGPEDKACHAHKGRTRRTEVMYGAAGNWYVYLCYGVHWMLNIVTGPVDYPAAVLIRGAGGCHGPGRLTRLMGITGELNGRAAVAATGLWIEQGEPVEMCRIATSARIGVDYAGPDWSRRPYRFFVKP